MNTAPIETVAQENQAYDLRAKERERQVRRLRNQKNKRIHREEVLIQKACVDQGVEYEPPQSHEMDEQRTERRCRLRQKRDAARKQAK